uniref:Uncharacterized protein n=1 Tax=Timema monikensis TaxID=170555 RepID=A0A7R9EN88_9NEOP|nr:unnamed protein product [Timema monikensis]
MFVFLFLGVEVSLPLTKQKKVRCYQEKKQESDDRNYEIEQFTKNEDVISSIERKARNVDCIVETSITDHDSRDKDVNVYGHNTRDKNVNIFDHNSRNKDVNIYDHNSRDKDVNVYGHNTRDKDVNVYDHNIRDKDVNVYDHNTRDSYTNTYDMGNIPRFRFDSLSAQIESNDPPEHPGTELVKSYQSSTNLRRQEEYTHQERSEQRTRLPGFEPGLNYETSANDVDLRVHSGAEHARTSALLAVIVAVSTYYLENRVLYI